MVQTQPQPIKGIAIWKKAKIAAMPIIRGRFIFGSFSPFAIETEKASIASPTPRRMLLKKKVKRMFSKPLCANPCPPPEGFLY